jgi:hypothetical protein
VAGREQDRKIAGRAEADDPGFAGAVLAAFQPLPHGINIVKRHSLALCQINHQGPDAAEATAPGEQVQRYRKKTLAGQPIGMTTRHVSQAEDVMEHDDRGPGPFALRLGQVALELVVGSRDRHLGHIVCPARVTTCGPNIPSWSSRQVAACIIAPLVTCRCATASPMPVEVLRPRP